jgi:NAD(P)-dependent dehydrogenase (short-subunit alcohol dehydrogenase family)
MTLLDIPPRRILGRFLPIKLPPAGSFKGLTVLITGGTSGLGLAAALHFVHLGADVLITCRDPRRGEKAREHIEAAAGGKQDGKVVGVFELDMSSYASCETFLQNLKEWFGSRGVRGGLDIAVLNAGRIDPHFSLSPEGW